MSGLDQQGTTNEALAEAVFELRDQVQVLWHAIDELREGIDYALRNGREPDWHIEPPGTFSDLPPDRYCDELAARLNETVPANRIDEPDRHPNEIAHDEEGTEPPDGDFALDEPTEEAAPQRADALGIEGESPSEPQDCESRPATPSDENHTEILPESHTDAGNTDPSSPAESANAGRATQQRTLLTTVTIRQRQRRLPGHRLRSRRQSLATRRPKLRQNGRQSTTNHSTRCRITRPSENGWPMGESLPQGYRRILVGCEGIAINSSHGWSTITTRSNCRRWPCDAVAFTPAKTARSRTRRPCIKPCSRSTPSDSR